MKKFAQPIILTLIVLFLLQIIAPVGAAGPTELDTLIIKLWPEYDDPRLLVIIDGQLTTPGSEIRLPIPAEAKLNAVATADGSGRLLKNEWHEEQSEDGRRLLVMIPENPIFRVEYYTPFSIDGDKRTVKFELPAGYFNADQVTIETLLPPGSEDIQLKPPADESGPTQDDAHIFQRTLGEVKDQPVIQEVSYVNPSGALTVPESPTTSETLLQPQSSPQSETAPAATPKTSLNFWIIALGVAAVILIIGGVIGLWLTRDRDDEETLTAPPRTQGGSKKKQSFPASRKPATGNMDRFCRQCGKEFGEDDRFCRYCGAPRQTL